MTSDDRCDRGVTSDERWSHRVISSIALVDRAARWRGAIVRRAEWSTSGARPTNMLVDRAAPSTITPRDLVDRNRRSCYAISSIAIVDRTTQSRRSHRSSAQCDRQTSGAIWALSSLSLSLFFRKLFEVKMRGENDFWVKGKNIGQPEVIFRKMIFSVTAKHVEKGENDFLKSFSPKTNAP